MPAPDPDNNGMHAPQADGTWAATGQSAGLLDQIIACSPIGIAVIDFAGRYRAVNPAYCALYGHTAEAMLASGFLMVFEPALHARVLALHQRFLTEPMVLKGEWEVLRSDGQRLNIFTESVRVPGEDGRPHRLVYVLDITQRAQMERALREAEEAVRERESLLRDLAERVPVVLFRLADDAVGQRRFQYVSAGIEALIGITPAQLVADPFAMHRCILPEDLPGHSASIEQATRLQVAWQHEYRLRALNGQVKWVSGMAMPLREADGRLVWSGVITDITDRKHTEARLVASEQTYRDLFETVPQGVVYHDSAGRITAANPAAQRILGLTLDQLQGRHPIDPIWQAVHEDGSPFPGEQHPAMRALATGQAVDAQVMGVRAPGRGQVWIRVSATPQHKGGRVESVYASFEDITRQVDMARELQQQATTDDLTGAANRRSFMARLGIEFQRMQRHATLRCSLLALDIDWFKRVNDTWGHAAGDAVLRHLTQLMRQVTRQGDLVGRTGGEEFMLLLPDTSPDEALALAHRLREQVQATPVPWQGGTISITVSLGLSAVLADDADTDQALARADRALYAAKAAGRNTVCVSAPQNS